MILGFETTIVVYVALAALFRLLLAVSHTAALMAAIVLGSFALLALNAALFAYLAMQVVWTLALYRAARFLPNHARRLSWLAFLGLVPFNLQIWFGDSEALRSAVSYVRGDIGEGVVWTAGAAFFVIKSFVALREAIQEGRLRLLPMLAGLTFAPAFPAGPIFGTKPFRREEIARRIEVRRAGIAVMQLGWGAAAFYVIAPRLRDLAAEVSGQAFGIVADVYLRFAALFFDFSGYTLMAIAMAAFFGVTLPENFNQPYLATSIREFWQRWHMSLSWFVSTYLFKPFVRQTGMPRIGIFLAFTVIGLWHEVSIGYLLWGLGHGCALSLAMKPPEMWTRTMARIPPRPAALAGWFLTMTWVAVLSYTASESLLGAR